MTGSIDPGGDPTAGAGGVFTVSIDLEAAWGICDRPFDDADRQELAQERIVVRALLDMFQRWDVRATWAVVAHLLEAEPERDAHGLPHPSIPRPIVRDEARDWFFQLPDEPGDPAWYGADLVEMVREAVPAQEIGSHSFSHMMYDEQGTSRAAIDADLALAKSTHATHGLPFDSFVFPRNIVGYRDSLAAHGIKIYRDTTVRLADRINWRPARRAANLGRFLVGLTPPTVLPRRDEHGLVAIPDSMLLLGRRGVRRLVPSSNLVRMAVSGLNAAARKGRVFHLWFHPSNFATDTEVQLAVLDRILKHAAELRDSGGIRILTMGDLAADANL